MQIHYQTINDVPSPERLRELSTNEEGVGLVFPDTLGVQKDKRELIARLKPLLPDHSVFDSGGTKNPPETWVSIVKVLSEAEILAHADLLTEAARQFRHAAQERMQALADHLGVGIEAFANPDFTDQQLASIDTQFGELEDGGRFFFHGGDCGLTTPQGQIVEVKFGFPGEFGVLDPYFFLQFTQTTPTLANAFAVLQDDFHVAARALDILHQYGYLVEVTGEQHNFIRRGLIAADE